MDLFDRPNVYAELSAHGAMVDNWDGEGARAPTHIAIAMCQHWIDGLPAWWPQPSIYPSVEGGVIMEWNHDKVDLFLTFDNSGQVEADANWYGINTSKRDIDDALDVIFGNSGTM